MQFARQVTVFVNSLVIKSVIVPRESLGDAAVAAHHALIR